MHNRHPLKSKPKKVSRVYQLRPKSLQSAKDKSEKNVKLYDCGQASSGSRIDLPVSSPDAAVNSVTQSISFDQDIEPLDKPERHLLKAAENVFSLSTSEFSVTEYKEYLPQSSKHVSTQTLENACLPSMSGKERGIREIEAFENDTNSFKLEKMAPKSYISSDISKSSLHGMTGIIDPAKQLVSATDNVADYVHRGSVEVAGLKDKLKRPQYQVSGFMEDHAEFSTDWRETADRQEGRYTPSVLESTVDGSVIKGARRSYGSRVTPEDLDNFIDMAIEIGTVQKDPLIALDEWGLKTEQHKYKCSVCETVSKTRSDIENHIAASQKDHKQAVVIVLIGPEARGRNCPVCNVRLQRTHLFKHIRDSHSTFFPLRCGYCVFMGQDHNQLRHHIRKKHGTTKYRIIDISRILAESNDSGEKSLVDEEEHSAEESKEESSQESMQCPICGKVLKTLRNLKKHVIQHSRQKQQCSLCTFTTTFPTQIRSHFQRRHPTQSPQWQKVTLDKSGNDGLVEDVAPYLNLITSKYGVRQPKKEKKWMRQYRCPHCDYTCNFNSSYNRHLRLHNGFKPFKCGYCDFHAREAYVVKKHCMKIHKGKEPLVESDKKFKAPYRYDSRTKKEKSDWTSSVGDEEPNSNQASSNPSSKEASSVNQEAAIENWPENLGLVDEKLFLASSSASFAKKFECLTFNTLSVVPEGQIESSVDAFGEQCKTRTLEQVPENRISSAVVSFGERETLNSQSDNFDLQTGSSCQLLTDGSIESKTIYPELSSFRNGEIQPVKVKTFKVQNSLQKKSLKVNDSYIDKRKTSSIVLQPELVSKTSNILETIFDSENCEPSICSISEVSLEADNISDKTVVIELSSAELEGNTPRQDPSEESEAEQKQSGMVMIPLDIDQRIEDSTHHTKIQDVNNTAVQPVIPNDSILSDSDKFSEAAVMKETTGSPTTAETLQTQSTAPHGLESTLHTHIAFLTDSLVQHLSSPISATPGVMTRDLLGLDYSNSDYFSSEKVRLMMKKKSGGRVKCSVCGVTTTYRAFYKHAKKHFHIKPFKCGYCSYRSIEKSKIRVHNTFCHPSRPCVILKLSPEMAAVCSEGAQQTADQTDSLIDERTIAREKDEEECSTMADSTKSSNNSSTFVKPLPQSCSSTEGAILQDENIDRMGQSVPCTSSNASTGPSTFQCPICHKQLQIHTPSIRRHMYSHYGYKPYKCGYCSYTAIAQNEIRAHHVTHGFTTMPKVESSGVAMPACLSSYISELFGQNRGNKKTPKKRGQLHQLEEEDMEMENEGSTPPEPSDLVWPEMDNSKEELATIYFTQQDPSQEALGTNDDQECLQDLAVGDGHMTEPLESVDLSSEAAYAVQVLEAGQNPGSSSRPTPQLDLDTGQLDSNQVCVVYLIK